MIIIEIMKEEFNKDSEKYQVEIMEMKSPTSQIKTQVKAFAVDLIKQKTCYQDLKSKQMYQNMQMKAEDKTNKV